MISDGMNSNLQDVNQNGVSALGELNTTSAAGIKLVNLLATSSGAKQLADGSAITRMSTFEITGGPTGYHSTPRRCEQTASNRKGFVG